MRLARNVALCCLPIAFAVFGSARANVAFDVNVDTSSISAGAGYALAFQLTDGSGTGDANNTVVVDNFGFGGGSAGGCPALCTITGDASGDATSAVTLIDTSFFNSFAEAFTPGSHLSFRVTLTTNVDVPAPDMFAFSILLNGASIPTLDDTGADTFVSIGIDSASPLAVSFGTLPGNVPAIDAPQVTTAQPPNPAPEPGTPLLVAAALAALARIGRRRSLQRPDA